MRMIIGSVTLLVALVGCAPQDSVALDHRAELPAQARGVMLSESGEQSNVGMFHTTCEVDTSYAGIGDDIDYTEADEIVIDGEVDAGTDKFLVLTPDHVFITIPDAPEDTGHRIEGVVSGQLFDGGFVGLAVPVTPEGDCSLHWTDIGALSDTSSVSSLGVNCDADSTMSTDAETGTSFVSTQSGIYQVTRQGSVVQLSNSSNAMIAWDGVSDVLYEASGSTVAALEVNGGERWSVDLDGTITALTDMGSEGNATVSVLAADGSGSFVILDGASGSIESQLPTPSSAEALSVSGNGKVLAITLTDVVHYFDLAVID